MVAARRLLSCKSGNQRPQHTAAATQLALRRHIPNHTTAKHLLPRRGYTSGCPQKHRQRVGGVPEVINRIVCGGRG